MKNTIKYVGILALSLGLLGSCETVDFGNENLNPNQPSKASTAALLTSAIKSLPSHVSEVEGNMWVQYISQITYTEGSRYSTEQWSYDGWYAGGLKDLQEIIDLNELDASAYTSGGTTANQVAVAKILKAYYFQFITDTWGMVPFNEALLGVDNITPAFDSQEDIYIACFAMIDEALASINTSGNLSGDILFDGNMENWKKFANTLKMNMALRIADVNAATAQAKFNEAMPGVIGSVSENINYPYLSEDTNDNPWQDRFETREDYALSDVFTNHLNTFNDPRITEFAELPATGGDYTGVPYGVASPNVLQANVSFIDSDIIYDGTSRGGVIYSYAQIAFSIAEASVRGWTSESAADWYEKGIQASMDQWGISEANASAYLAQDAVKFNSDKAMEQIATEKWVALFLQGSEAWAEWRRLDYPQLSPAPDALSGNGIPVRYGYSANVASLNEANYNAAVSAQGADNQDTKLWWDKN
ncbi:MAG: SusD/RagB family nutrient-binding outer membrane lipoprotein [Flavobacteriia bacterium]|nr:SusD/RagB family nutrient-binding outer membrane lipoprotein [Flavobacteriia bacterium]